MPSRRRSSMMSTPPNSTVTTGATGGRLFTTAASRRSATQMLNLASLSSERGHGTIGDGGNLADEGGAKLCDDEPKGSAYSGNEAVGDATGSSGARGGRRSQLPANILRRMFGGGGGRRGDGTDQPNESRRGSNDTCPDDEDDDGQQAQRHQHRTVTVRDLGYDAPGGTGGDTDAGLPSPSARPSVLVTATPRRSSLRTESNTDEALQQRRRRRSSASSAVSFDEDVRFLTIPSLDSLSILQRTQLYYDRDDYADLQDNIKDDIRSIRQRDAAAGGGGGGDGGTSIADDVARGCAIDDNDDHDNDGGPCSRGIEHYLLPKPERLARVEAAAHHIVELVRYQHTLQQQQKQQQRPYPNHPPPSNDSSDTSTTGTEQSLPAATTTTTTDEEDQEVMRSLPLQLAARSLQLSGPARHLAREIGRADEDYVRRVWGWHRHHPPVASTGGNRSDGGDDADDDDGICCSSSTSTRSQCSSCGSCTNSAKGASASSLLPLPPVTTNDSNEERARCA